MREKKIQVCAQVDEETLRQAKINSYLKRQSLSEYICDALRWQVNHDNRRIEGGKELYTGKAGIYEIDTQTMIDNLGKRK